jgi:hypothetical protein
MKPDKWVRPTHILIHIHTHTRLETSHCLINVLNHPANVSCQHQITYTQVLLCVGWARPGLSGRTSPSQPAGLMARLPFFPFFILLIKGKFRPRNLSCPGSLFDQISPNQQQTISFPAGCLGDRHSGRAAWTGRARPGLPGRTSPNQPRLHSRPAGPAYLASLPTSCPASNLESRRYKNPAAAHTAEPTPY